MNWNIFKRKKKEDNGNEEIVDILIDYLDKARKLGWEDKKIKDKFRFKGYSEDLINLVFNIYEVKGGNKMIKKKKVEEDEDLDADDLEEEEETE
jgi:hypothetical protein